MKKRFLYILALAVILMNGCQKEKSFEVSNNPSAGSLQNEVSGDCLPKTVNGVYAAGAALVSTTNTITVQVNVITAGNYTIYTDTVNGYYFRGTGLFTAAGITNVTLRGNGTPFVTEVDNFVVTYDSTSCDIAVTVLPAGAGGPAVYTLPGTSGNCTGAVVTGSYGVGVALNPTNTVTITVNVTTIGTYSISSTPTNGMTFSATGTFTTTGTQTVTLTPTSGSTPTTAGANMIPITVGSTTACSFTVNVGAAAVYTFAGSGGGCTSASVNGTYTVGTTMDVTNTVTLTVNVTTPGVYSITTAIVGNMIFSGSGSFTTTGMQTVTLNGSNTAPSTAGANIITVSSPSSTSSCTFTVTVVAGSGVGTWSFTQGSNHYQGATDDATQQDAGAGFTDFDYLGTNTATDQFEIDLLDIGGGIHVGETYNTASTTGNTGGFTYSGTSVLLTADPTTAGTSVIITVTAYDATNKTITCTFSGTVKDLVTSTLKTITGGQFTCTYH